MEVRKDVRELVDNFKELTPTSQMLIISNANVLLARDKMEQEGKERKDELAVQQ